MKRLVFPVLLASALLLSACASAAAAQPSTAAANPPTLVAAPMMPASPASQSGSDDLTRVDEQGMVVVEVTPENLKDPSGTLDFEVAMNTHSVDLSMDLSQLATLTTDTGISVQANAWDAPGGGHHVSGKLTFPATKDGKPILDGATKITVTILNVDAPTRTFEWELR